MKLYYQQWDKPSSDEKNKIVLLHGMGGTGSLWRPIAVGLEDSISVIAPDQRGHGKSQILSSSTYTPLDYGQDVLDTLQDIDFHPTWILGHSMGARTAVAAAHLKPELFRGVILVDLGFAGHGGGGLGEQLKACLEHLPKSFPSREEARSFLDQNCPDPSIAQYLMAVALKDPQGTLTFPFDQRALLETLKAVQNFSMRDWIRALGQRGMPVLVFRGAQSRVWSQADFLKEKEIFSDLSSIVFEEVQGAGHGLPFEQRPYFVERVKQFVSDLR